MQKFSIKYFNSSNVSSIFVNAVVNIFAWTEVQLRNYATYQKAIPLLTTQFYTECEQISSDNLEISKYYMSSNNID